MNRSATLLLACLAMPGIAWAQSSSLMIQRLSPVDRGVNRAPVEPQAAAPAPASPAAGRVRPPPSTRPAAPPQTTTAAPTLDLTVQFATNSTQLLPPALRTLGELGRALSSPELARYRFRIEGHTDTVGSPERNKQLSEERAARVVDYLATQFHVDRARIQAVGLGQEQLLVPTPPNTPNPRNRRVTVVNLGT